MTIEKNTLAPEEADRVLTDLLKETVTGSLRWGFQPPATAQANRGNTHFVLRLRKRVYRLTARRDGSKQVGLVIERIEAENDFLTKLFRLAIGEQE